jgi:endogenous inhibitor of DNA gyrase (YacG/DUF329 family)
VTAIERRRELATRPMLKCARCGTEQPRAAFYRDRYRTRGRDIYCILCRKIARVLGAAKRERCPHCGRPMPARAGEPHRSA